MASRRRVEQRRSLGSTDGRETAASAAATTDERLSGAEDHEYGYQISTHGNHLSVQLPQSSPDHAVYGDPAVDYRSIPQGNGTPWYFFQRFTGRGVK